MHKIVLFAAVVVLGTLGTLVLFNQNSSIKPPVSPEALNLNQTPSPVAVNILNQTPAPTQPITPSFTPALSLSTFPTPEATSEAHVTIKTSKGDITLTLYTQDAPNTVKNFINKAKSGFYTNLTFHRVEDWVIQGGDPSGNGTGGGQMPTELNNKSFVVGSLGVARGGDIKVSNDAQFFIIKKDASWLNNQYTNFGIVINGMDVVNKIEIGDKILGINVE